MASTQDNFNTFYSAESTLSSAAPVTLNGRAVYRFAPPYGVTRIPLHIRTGEQALHNLSDMKKYDAGDPVGRKRFQQVEFHGKGSLYVRVYVDGSWVSDGTVTLTETPSKSRRLGIPIGTRGYMIDVEFCGDADVRAVEFTYEYMQSPS
jgi:hypothetical protein